MERRKNGQPLVSIIIVNFQTKELTKQTIDSIIQTTKDTAFEVIVVDNSTDPCGVYSDRRENISVFRLNENKGFGNACNQGAGHANGGWLLFLNSDTILHPGALDKCMGYCMSNPNIGALGIQMLLKDGTLDHGCKRGFPTPRTSLYYFFGLDRRNPQNRKYGAYRQTFVPQDSICEVDAVSGAFLLMTKSLFEDLGGFDECFFMYGEDLDLCYRIKQMGHQVVYYGEASMTHLKGQSGLHTKSKFIIKQFYQAMHIFYKKHYHTKYPLLINWLVYSGIELKYFWELCKARIIRT